MERGTWALRDKIDKSPRILHSIYMPRQRITRQQLAIEGVFKETDRPLSPQEVLDQAREEVPCMGLATVYRALNRMVEEKILRAVELPGQSPRYEPANLPHHHHFHCHQCGKVFDLEGCLLKEDIHLPGGFKLISHDITLSGICPDCGK